MVCEETNSNPAADECILMLGQLKWWGDGGIVKGKGKRKATAGLLKST